MSETTTKTGARLLVETLAANGIERVFAGPGASRLGDALAKAAIRVVAARGDAGAAFMAEATGKLTGRAGICRVSEASGAAAAFAGLQVAAHDATPMILFVEESDHSAREGGALGDTGLGATFGGIAKWVAEIASADRVVEIVNRAFSVAANGRPGPVVLGLSRDALAERVAAPAAILPAPIVETHPGAAQMWDLQKRLWAAKRPLAVLGGSRWSAKAVRQFARFVDKFDLPVACATRRQMLFDHDDLHFVGDLGSDLDPALAARIRDADLTLVVGDGTEEMFAHGALLDRPFPRQSLVHVHVRAEEFGRAHRPDLAIHAAPTAFAAAAEGLEPPPAGVAWAAWRAAARADREAWASAVHPTAEGAILAHLARTLTPEAIVAGSGGADPLGLERLWRFRRFGTQVAPTSGARGSGLPGGIAAKLTHPDAPVIVVTDGADFQTTSQEFATAIEEGAAVIVIVVEAGERKRTIASDVTAIARVQGGFGATIEPGDDFGSAVDAALVHGGPALLHVRMSSEAVTPEEGPSEIEAVKRP